MARLRLEIEIPGYTAEELRNLVAAVDEADSAPEPGIDAENVSAHDVFELIYAGALPFMEGDIADAVVKGMKESGIDIPQEPIPQLQYFHVLQDEMWD